LQSTPDPTSPDADLDQYAVDVAGLPLMFSVEGSHSRQFSRWVFPDPTKHFTSHDLDDLTFVKVCKRFRLVREDLQKELLKQVKERVSRLAKVEDDSDSSGLSDKDFIKGLRADYMARQS